MSVCVKRASVVTNPPGQCETREHAAQWAPVNRRDLIHLIGHRHLTEHHTEALAEGAQQVRIRRAAAGATPQRLAVSGWRTPRGSRKSGKSANTAASGDTICDMDSS